MKKLKDHFKINPLVKNLFETEFYNHLLNDWEKFYFQIYKKKLNINPRDFNSIKNVNNYLIKFAINHIGLNEILFYVDNNRQEFKNSSVASRCKVNLRENSKRENYDEGNELVLELDKKVKEIAEEYRD